MPRYIDIEPIENAAEEYGYSIVSIALIKEQPTADVRENVHGKWLTVETSHEWVDDFCSVCGYKVGMFWARNFCPNCGADMRGSE